MRRVISLWFPHWPTDRQRRRRSKPRADGEVPLPAGLPLVTALHDGRRRVVAAVDQEAARLGLRPGMAMAHALALVPDLHVLDAEPEADAAALHRLALWSHRYTPLASPAPQGLWLEVGGSAHLFGGEAALLKQLLDRLHRDGLQARGAVADTPGAAYALARHGERAVTVVPPGAHGAAIAGLPVIALRLPAELDATLRRLGFEQVEHLARIPRGLLVRRFGTLVGLRLDQAHGALQEPILPIKVEQALRCREAFLEPLLTAEALAIAITRLVTPLCAEMERGGVGARRLDLLFERLDSHVVAVRIGTAHPSRDGRHLARLLQERLDTVDPGMGIEAMHLIVALAEPLSWQQQASVAAVQDMARLVDRLSNRLGPERIYRAEPLESPVPENIVGRANPLDPVIRQAMPAVPPHGSATPPDQNQTDQTKASCDKAVVSEGAPSLRLVASAELPPSSKHRPGPHDLKLVHGSPASAPEDLHMPQLVIVLPWKRLLGSRRTTAITEQEATNPVGPRAWPSRLKAPARLLVPPHPVTAIAALPHQAPASFTWRRRKNKVHRAEGPERIHEIWWLGDHETDAVRDYFQVEVEGGQRFWLFRQGNGLDLRTGNLDWFLHGLF